MAHKFTTKEMVLNDRLRLATQIIPCVVDYSLMHFAGNVEGKSVMDLACGEGRHLRMLKMKGAEKAVGVDISEEMLLQARNAEEKSPTGCTFQLGDARKLGKIGDFDLITALGLFLYAETMEELLMICKNVCLNLKKGGRFVGISFNCQVENPDWSQSIAKYGIRLVPGEENEEGRRTMRSTVDTGNGEAFTIENYWFPFKVMDQVFSNSGFSSYSFEASKLDPEIVAQYPVGHWDSYLEKPHHTIFLAYK